MSLALTPNQTRVLGWPAPRRCLVSEVNCPVISCCLATLIPNTCSASSRAAAPQGRQAQGNARRIWRLSYPMALGRPEERCDRIGADRQANVIEPKVLAVASWCSKSPSNSRRNVTEALRRAGG